MKNFYNKVLKEFRGYTCNKNKPNLNSMCLESKFEAIVIKRLLEFLATSTATIKINFTDNTFGLKISIQFFYN